MSDVTQTQTLEQTLNKTDFGHILYENRKIFFGALLAVLFLSTGYVVWRQSQKASALNTSVKVFEFQTKVWDSAKGGKLAVAELVKAFEGLGKDVQTAAVMVPVGLEMGKFLIEKNALFEAETVLSKIDMSHPVTSFFVGMQRSVALEKQNKLAEAIAVLEKIATDKEVLMASKVNLELGRLNLALGEKAKAQTHFDYVINTFPNDDQAKLAKLYLAKLKQ